MKLDFVRSRRIPTKTNSFILKMALFTIYEIYITKIPNDAVPRTIKLIGEHNIRHDIRQAKF